jgi:CheY-like chemotaxis protein
MGKRKVLVVDDIFANQFLLASMLEEMDCNIRTASNGQEVFDALKGEMFDIIFMDIEMPVMNGIEATKKLKADPKYRDIPVIALTAHNLEEFNEMFENTGFDGLLEKPYSCEGISEVLAKF